MSEVKKVWNEEGNRLYLSYPSKEFDNLDNGAIYTVGVDDYGRFYLVKKSEGYVFDYKLYGLETSFINRVLKTFDNTNGNLGILLNGIKGTGKTVSSKLIASKSNLPIVLIDRKLDGIHTFLNSITQDITIFIDEYEKVFGESSAMLTIMDGALNSTFRRLFLMTTNDLYVDKNLIERPSRIRYLKMFSNLKPEVVEEIVDDILEYPELKKECISFISSLETITIDIVKAVLNEVNIHQEAPSAFEDVFNVKKIKGNYNVKLVEDGQLTDLAKNVRLYPRPTFTDSTVGHRFEIDGNTIGRVSRIINWTTIELTPYQDDKGKNVGFSEPIILKIEDADAVNYSYTYGSYDEFGNPTNNHAIANANTKELSATAKSIIKAFDEDDEDEIQEEVGLKMPVTAMPSVDLSVALGKAISEK